MIEESARVVAVEGDVAWVETRRNSVCGSCAANKGCGTTALAKVVGVKYSRLRVLNAIAAKAGDEVVIGIEENALVRGSLAMYAIPVVLLLVFAGLGDALNNQMQITTSEIISVVSGLFGLAGGFFWVSRYAGKISYDGRYQPVMLRKAEGSASRVEFLQGMQSEV
ncbi:MAG: SoxR reducing system RseC family protein [Gammaproteobacteria bacterium]|jgi:sigma-E factor negative regulatory protein RseC|nr:SoxR reducing system RseC family protein [Gammaproteobacteria bacterium]